MKPKFNVLNNTWRNQWKHTACVVHPPTFSRALTLNPTNRYWAQGRVRVSQGHGFLMGLERASNTEEALPHKGFGFRVGGFGT